MKFKLLDSFNKLQNQIKKIEKPNFKLWAKRLGYNSFISGNYLSSVLISLIFAIYIVATIMIGKAVLSGKESDKLLVTAKFLPIPIAQVNNQFIWFKEYVEYKKFIEHFIKSSGQNNQPIDLETPLDIQITNIIIQNSILERIAKEANINVSQKEIDQSFKQILVAQNGGGPNREVSEEELNTILEELYGSNKTQLKELIRIKLIENKIKTELIEQVKFRQILLATEKQAKETIERLKSGQKFEDLAKELSKDDQTRDKGGEVNFISRSVLPSPLEEKLFSLDKGLIEEPIKTEFGYHIVEVLDRKGNIKQSFSDWLSNIRQQYKVIIHLRAEQ